MPCVVSQKVLDPVYKALCAVFMYNNIIIIMVKVSVRDMIALTNGSVPYNNNYYYMYIVYIVNECMISRD